MARVKTKCSQWLPEDVFLLHFALRTTLEHFRESLQDFQSVCVSYFNWLQDTFKTIICKNGSNDGSVNDISKRMSKSKKTNRPKNRKQERLCGEGSLTLNVILAKISQLLPS